jgi:hypothetical protein
MSNQLTPREHSDIRDLLLAGSQQIKPSGARRALVPAAVAIVLVVGVVGTVVATTLGGSTGRIGATPQPTSTSTVPQLCLDYERSEVENAPGGEAIAAAAASADLGADAVLSPFIQVLESTDRPGTFEATAAVCGNELNNQELTAAATAIAKAIYADPAHTNLSVLTVSAWKPISSDAIGEDPNGAPISTDYQAHDWDAAPETLDAAWDFAGTRSASPIFDRVRTSADELPPEVEGGVDADTSMYAGQDSVGNRYWAAYRDNSRIECIVFVPANDGDIFISCGGPGISATTEMGQVIEFAASPNRLSPETAELVGDTFLVEQPR